MKRVLLVSLLSICSAVFSVDTYAAYAIVKDGRCAEFGTTESSIGNSLTIKGYVETLLCRAKFDGLFQVTYRLNNLDQCEELYLFNHEGGELEYHAASVKSDRTSCRVADASGNYYGKYFVGSDGSCSEIGLYSTINGFRWVISKDIDPAQCKAPELNGFTPLPNGSVQVRPFSSPQNPL